MRKGETNGDSLFILDSVIGVVPLEILKTFGFDLGCQHFPQDIADVNKWKIMFDPSIGIVYHTRLSMYYIRALIYNFLYWCLYGLVLEVY